MNSIMEPNEYHSETFVDPVCGMKVIPGETKLVAIYKRNTYWFCGEACRQAFEAKPKKYTEPKSEEPKSWIRKSIDRIINI